MPDVDVRPRPASSGGGTRPAPTEPHTGTNTPAVPDGAKAGTADRTRTIGTKGGRAVVPPGAGGTVSGPGDGPTKSGRVSCSGKRRAVLAGERTPC
ncbi:hypothetical protein [Actinoplanes philippinensis]|uniref:hypothetical protein n=1 Tax=Actinoplanes philippinensis TaxID=35752 RepID=UPI0033E14468